jgi:hypothetical protein
MTRARLSLMAMTAGLVGVGCQVPAEAPKPEADEPFHKELLQVARDYKAWGRVDDPMRLALADCRAPLPARARASASADADTHGQKLYSLFAKDRDAYAGLTAKGAAVGQVVVKEAWSAEEMKDMKAGATDWTKVVRTEDVGEGGTHFYPYATRGDKVFKASQPAGLFVMMKLDPKTEGTDDGWVYGTVSADGKSVTSAGRVASCMKCHQEAKHDRLFGLAAK